MGQLISVMMVNYRLGILVMEAIDNYDWFKCGVGFLKTNGYEKCPVCGADKTIPIDLALAIGG